MARQAGPPGASRKGVILRAVVLAVKQPLGFRKAPALGLEDGGRGDTGSRGSVWGGVAARKQSPDIWLRPGVG